MPTYQYICKQCGHQLEELQSMKEPPLVSCPECKQDTLARIMGGGSGLIFKGSGFYLTDYKGNEKKSQKPADKKTETKTDSAPASGSSDTKPASPPPSEPKTP